MPDERQPKLPPGVSRRLTPEEKKWRKKHGVKNGVDPKAIGKQQQAEANRSGRQSGAFVYRGSGKKHAKDSTLSERKCEKQTIAVQWCLARNDHKQDRCQGLVDVWKECKAKFDAIEKQSKQ
jgi:hypothetical protein